MGALRALSIPLLACLALSSCGIFFVSPFPTTLAQTMAQRDFSNEIDDPSLDKFQPYVLEKVTGSATTRLILLVGGLPYPKDKPWLFVMREDLSFAQDPFTLGELNTIASPFNGTRAMIDSDGQVVVGNALFDVTGATITPVGIAGGLGGLYSWGFPISPSGDHVANMGSSLLTLTWERYMPCWLAQGPGNCQIRSTGRTLWLRDVFADPNPATTTVILAFEEGKDPAADTTTTYFVRVPRAQFAGSPAPNFLEDRVNYPSTTKTDLESSHMGYTADGIVAYEHSSQSWTMFPFDAPGAVQQLYVGNISDDLENQRVSWSFSGGYSCVYDRRTRTLSKVAKWWK
jgi:hypothetical protein